MSNNLLIFTQSTQGFNNTTRNIPEAYNIKVYKNKHGDASLTFSLPRVVKVVSNDLGIGFFIECTDTNQNVVFRGIVRSIVFKDDPDGVAGDEDLEVECVGFQAMLNEGGNIASKAYANTTPQAVIADVIAQLSPTLKVGSLVNTGISGIDYNNPPQNPPPNYQNVLDSMCAIGDSSGNSVFWRVGKDRKVSTYSVSFTNPVARYSTSRANANGFSLRSSLDEVYTSVIVYYKAGDGSTLTYTATDPDADKKYGIIFPGEVSVSPLKKPLIINLTSSTGTITPTQAQYIAKTALNRVKRLSYKSDNVVISKRFAIADNKSATFPWLIQAGEFLEITDLSQVDSYVVGTGINNIIFISEVNYDDETGILTIVPESQISISDYVAQLTREVPDVPDYEVQSALPPSPQNAQYIYYTPDSREYMFNSTVNKWVTRQEFRGGSTNRGGNPVIGQVDEFVEICDDSDGLFVESITGTFVLQSAQSSANFYQIITQVIVNNGNGGSVVYSQKVADITAVNLGGGIVQDTKTLTASVEYPFKVDVNRAFQKGYTRMVAAASNNGSAGALYLWACFKYRLIRYPKGLSDSFNRAASTVDPGSADSTHLWTVAPTSGGTLAGITVDGKLYFTAGSTFPYTCWTRMNNTKNFTGTVKLKSYWTDATNFQVMALGFRGTSANNCIYFQVFNGFLSINKLSVGVFAGTLAQSAMTTASGTEYTLTFTVNENALSVTCNGTTVNYTLAGADSTMFNAANCDFVQALQFKNGSPPAGTPTMDDLIINPL